MKVTVFGGADPRPGEPAYEEARHLGALLARAGHVVVTGGYIGTMEAASQGACEAGGHTIGATCDQIEQWRGVRPNRWVREEWRSGTLFERLQALIEQSDAAIALAGGAGTLAEISLVWNLVLIDALARRPLVLVGDDWRVVFETLFDRFGAYIPTRSRELITFAPTVERAVGLLAPVPAD
ncbi:MAG: LOG family protein [Candidatus Riflebacteria bacterium]|nr:LOG family protein [Candidatus Riflebacteria bacterium]